MHGGVPVASDKYKGNKKEVLSKHKQMVFLIIFIVMGDGAGWTIIHTPVIDHKSAPVFGVQHLEQALATDPSNLFDEIFMESKMFGAMSDRN